MITIILHIDFDLLKENKQKTEQRNEWNQTTTKTTHKIVFFFFFFLIPRDTHKKRTPNMHGECERWLVIVRMRQLDMKITDIGIVVLCMSCTAIAAKSTTPNNFQMWKSNFHVSTVSVCVEYH